MSQKDLLQRIVLIIFLLEATYIPAFLIIIPGSPYTLGRLMLILISFFGLVTAFKKVNQGLFSGVIIIVMSYLIGSLLSDKVGESLFSFVGFGLLFIAGLGLAVYFRKNSFYRLLDNFFVGSFIYWCFYILSRTIVGGSIVTYGRLYKSGGMEAGLLNYHSFGLLLSLSTVYIFARFFLKRRINFKGGLFIAFALVVLFLTESRANLFFAIFGLVFTYLIRFKVSISSLLLLIVTGVIVFFVFSSISSQNADLQQRYDLSDSAYIENTTSSRWILAYLALEHLVEHPFGQGPKKTQLEFARGIYFQPHNQYLSFLLAGGFLALLGEVLWITSIIKASRKLLREENYKYLPLISANTVFLVSILTVDVTGGLFFLMIGLQGYLVLTSLNFRQLSKI